MRNTSASLAPTAPAYNSVTTYIVLNDFGPNLGRAYVETDEAQADQKSIVENMITGQDIARAVADNLEAEGRAIKDDGVRCFVERQLES